MIVDGYVANHSGRHKHIFKRTVSPGQKVSLKELYLQYKDKCKCPFDEKFIKWLKENKIPETG